MKKELIPKGIDSFTIQFGETDSFEKFFFFNFLTEKCENELKNESIHWN